MLIINSAINRYFVVGMIAVAGGYLGSHLHHMTTSESTTIRAERFELVGRTGRVLSYWGPDADRNSDTDARKGTILVFLDSDAARRLQLGGDSSDSPHLLFYDKDRPTDTPKRYDARPRFQLQLGPTGSPVVHMRGSNGDQVLFGAHYGDADGEQELGWGLSFEAFKIPATASIGYGRWWDGSYRSSVFIADGAGKRWEAGVGELKPLPLTK